MKGDWFCPCLLLVLASIWLAVSAYFAATHWITVTKVDAEWTAVKCLMTGSDARPCSYLDEKSTVISKCRSTLKFSPIVTINGAKRRVGASGVKEIKVENEGPGDGCIFDNCAKAKESVPKKNNTDCWANAGTTNDKLVVADPVKSSRKLRIVFTVCSILAGLILIGSIATMCGLVAKNVRAL